MMWDVFHKVFKLLPFGPSMIFMNYFVNTKHTKKIFFGTKTIKKKILTSSGLTIYGFLIRNEHDITNQM